MQAPRKAGLRPSLATPLQPEGSVAHQSGPRDPVGPAPGQQPGARIMPAAAGAPGAPPPPFELPEGPDLDHAAALDFLKTLAAFLSQHGQEDVRLRLLCARQQLRRRLKGDPSLPDWGHCGKCVFYLVEEANLAIEEGRDMGSSAAEVAAQVSELLSEAMEAWKVGR